MAAGASARDRPPADLGAGRHHQLHHLRPQPAAARLRRRQGARADHGAAGAARRDDPRPRRQGLWLRRLRNPGLRRQRPREHRRRDGRAALGLHRGHRERLHRGGVFRPGAHRPHRPAPPDQLRRPLPLRTRDRPGLHAGRHGAGDADDPRSLRRRGLGGRDRGRRSEDGAQLPPRPFPRGRPRRHGDRRGRAGPDPDGAGIRGARGGRARARSTRRPGARTSRATPISSRRSPASPRSAGSRAGRSPACPASPGRS